MLRPLAALALSFTLGSLVVPGCSRTDARRLPVEVPELAPFAGWIANQGQWPASVWAAARGGGGIVSVAADGVITAVTEDGLERVALRPMLDGHTWNWCGEPFVAAGTGAVCHFPERRTGVPLATSLRRSGDPEVGASTLALRIAADGAPAYDLEVADPRELVRHEFVVDGAHRLRVDAASGDLVAETPAGCLRQSEPLAWQVCDGRRIALDVEFELIGPDRYRFRVVDPLRRGPVVIDPELRWATFVGGARLDEGHSISRAANGDVFVGGTTQSGDLPTDLSVLEPFYQGSGSLPRPVGDGWLARLAGDDGALQWVTYLGGAQNDALTIVRAVGDEVLAAGWTASPDFPVTAGAFDVTYNGASDGAANLGGDVFVSRISADGARLVWSTFIGGSRLEYPRSAEVDAAGQLTFAGHVHSPDYPTSAGGWRSSIVGATDAFVTRLAADGSRLMFSTYFGGLDGEEYPHGLHVDAGGETVIVGGTDSTDLPVTPGVFGPVARGGLEHEADGFLARFSADGSALLWCSYLATTSSERVRAVRRLASGDLVVGGVIDGPGLPTGTGVVGPRHAGGDDGFVAVVRAGATALDDACYVGGTGDDQVWSVADLGAGRILVGGRSASTDLRTTPRSAGEFPAGSADGLIWVLSDAATRLDHGTYLGGSSGDRLLELQVGPEGDVLAVGASYSRNHPLAGASRGYSGGGDAQIVRLAPLPAGVERLGAATAGCAGHAVSLVRAAPVPGVADFAATFGPLPARVPAVALLGLRTAPAPLRLAGVDLWLDPNSLFADLSVTSDSRGLAVVPLPVPADPALSGVSFALQLAWADACGSAGLAASDALRITVLD